MEELTDYKSSELAYNRSDSHESKLFDKRIWGIEEVCRFTTYKRGTIYNMVSEGTIPYRKPRNKLYFIPKEILCWIRGET